MGGASKLTAGGGVSAGVFLMTFTVGAAPTGVLGVLGTGSDVPVCIARLMVLRRELLEPPYSDCRSLSEASPGEEGDQVEDRGLEYAGVASSTRADRSRGIIFAEPGGDFGLRGPPGRWRNGAAVEKLEGERTRVKSMIVGRG